MILQKNTICTKCRLTVYAYCKTISIFQVLCLTQHLSDVVNQLCNDFTAFRAIRMRVPYISPVKGYFSCDKCPYCPEGIVKIRGVFDCSPGDFF